MSRVAQLTGAAVLVGAGLLAVFGGAASAAPAAGTEVPGSAVPIGTYTASTPFSSGQVIEVTIPANSTLTPGAGVFIVECAAPGGVVPTDPSECDGKTVQGDTVLVNTDGSVLYTTTNITSGYTVYALPDATSLGEPPTQTPVCNLSNECVLYIGQNQNDFTQPHFWSQPFYVTPTPGDTGANPGDGSAPPVATSPDAGTSTVTAAAVPPSPVADGKDPSIVTVRLLNASSVPVPGKTVTLTGGSGSSVITPGSAVSAADGTAVFTVTDTTSETVVYTALDTTDSITVTPTASVVFTAPVVTPANSTVVANPSQVAADGTTASTITVTLRDQGSGIGYAVPGKAVSLTASGGSSVVTPSSATTDSAGVATFSAVDSSTELVTYTAKDTTDNATLTQTASVTFGTLTVSPGTSTVVATSSTAQVNAGTSVTVTLLTSAGSPVSGKAVSLSGLPSTTVSISSTSSVTDQKGEATFSVDDSNAESVVFSAMDVTDSQAVIATASVVFQAPVASASASTITAVPSTVPADGSSSSAIVVTIRDQFGNALSGKTVTLQLTDASGDAEAPPVAGSATPGITDSSGRAQFGLVDTHAETVTVGATDTTDNNIVLSATVSVTFTAGVADPAASTVTGSPTNGAGTVAVASDGKTAATITVTLLDHQGSAVAGKNITLTASGGNSIVTPSSATTTSAGVATFSVTDSTAEVVTYMATDTTDNNLVLSTTVSVTFGSPPAPPPAVADSVVLASGTSAPADGTSKVTVTALLYDSNGNAVVGKTVTLNLQGAGHSVVTPASAVTDQNGQANFAVSDDTVDTVTYTATDTTDNLPITGQSVMIAFTTASSTTTTTATATTATSTTTPASSTTTTAAGGATTTTTASSVSSSGSGGSQASTSADSGTVNASSGQLALTGPPSLLPWLIGLGLMLLLGGSLGRRLLRVET